VSFGLAIIPIHLYSATGEQGTGFLQVHAERRRFSGGSACSDE
jgi:hypothetical protein